MRPTLTRSSSPGCNSNVRITASWRRITVFIRMDYYSNHAHRVVPRFSVMETSWQHGGPIPVRYRPLLQELRQEIAAKTGLEGRARKVNHELDTIALGR